MDQKFLTKHSSQGQCFWQKLGMFLAHLFGGVTAFIFLLIPTIALNFFINLLEQANHSALKIHMLSAEFNFTFLVDEIIIKLLRCTESGLLLLDIFLFFWFMIKTFISVLKEF